MEAENIEFDYELDRGIITYNEKVGLWWKRQAANATHRYAYRNIADFVRDSYDGAPRLIVDYACGGGTLLSRLHGHFPDSDIVGLDGSSLMLGMARKRLARLGGRARHRITLVETLLPDFGLARGIADLVLFVFPNIVSYSGADNGKEYARHLRPTDIAVARKLAFARDPDDGEEEDDPQTVYTTLLKDRLVSLNIRGLLKRGGICLRVEYGTVRREELPRLELLRTEFEEGALDREIDGLRADQWFRVQGSRYYRSGVIEDVYHQSQDERDLQGGYFITVLRAL